MLHIVLFQPEIPPNTGSIIRLAANTGATLHLIEPLGFFMDDRRLRRAGLDYHEFSQLKRWNNWGHFCREKPGRNLYAFSTRGRGNYTEVRYAPDDMLLFGPETSGLPEAVLDSVPPAQRLRIPMRANSRSLNLANAASVVLYEALRQLDFPF